MMFVIKYCVRRVTAAEVDVCGCFTSPKMSNVERVQIRLQRSIVIGVVIATKVTEVTEAAAPVALFSR